MIIDDHVKKILVLIPAGLGDFIKSLGIFLSLKRQFPDVILDVAVPDNGAHVLKKFISYVNDIIVLKIKKFTIFRYLSYFLFKGWSDIKRMDSQNYDLVICLTINPLRRYILTFISAKNKAVLPIHGTDVVREYEFVSDLGIKLVSQQQSFLDLTDGLDDMGFLSIDSGKKNIIINMFCADSPNSVREWSKWGDLIERLQDRFNIILIGKVNFDYKYYYDINYSKVVNLINKTNLESLISLFQKSDLIVTVDSSPFHLAYALGTPVIGLFGPVDPETRIPVSIARNNIYYLYANKPILNKKLKKELKKKSDVYMRDIEVEDVMVKIDNIFK